MSSTGRGRRRLLRILLSAVVIAAVGATGAAMWRPWEESLEESGSADSAAATTVPVEFGELTSRLRLNATLGYGEPIELPATQGMITALPDPGQVIEVGQQVFEVDGRPVVLLEGERPFWRELSSDSDDGQDVLQLEQNLAQLGFFDREPDSRFDWWTLDAVRRWQEELGIPVTGKVAVSDVVAVNAPSIRISHVTADLGETGVSPATYTATTLKAVTPLTPAQARELTPNTPVTVLLSDGTEHANVIASIDPGGQPTDEEGQTTPPTAVIEFPDEEQVTPGELGNIQVVVQSAEAGEETLIVPVTALIATAEDSYAVEVHAREQIVRVPVQIGLIVDARVQILTSGSDVEGTPSDAPPLEPGDEVVISR